MNLKLFIAAVGFGLLSTQAFAADDPAGQNPSPQTQLSTPQHSDAFLEKNKTKNGVTTLPDGLQYKVITAGKGVKPGPTDEVTVDYVGRLVNGTEFDSSTKHGGPATFVVGQVIPGWVEALQLMPVGSTWELYIPANLAYGERGAPPSIGPNETLIFKVTLRDVKKS